MRIKLIPENLGYTSFSASDYPSIGVYYNPADNNLITVTPQGTVSTTCMDFDFQNLMEISEALNG